MTWSTEKDLRIAIVYKQQPKKLEALYELLQKSFPVSKKKIEINIEAEDSSILLNSESS